ncbi:hypothetical protein J6590_104414 [Homalodisca vitripennis]|nr:hypothetical protein J6590_104414 [Homalodisca vitripennis]
MPGVGRGSETEGEVRAKKHYLTLNLGTSGLKVTRITTNGRAGGLLARTGSLSGHPSKQQPRSTLLDLPITVVLATLSNWQRKYVSKR